MTISTEDIEVDDWEVYNEEVAEMLGDWTVFPTESEAPEDGPGMIVLAVLTNDWFSYASADHVEIPFDEFPKLRKFYREDKVWGPMVWATLQRECRPIKPQIEKLKEKGLWNDELEALPERNV